MEAFISSVLAVNYEVVIWVTVMAIAILLEVLTVGLVTVWFSAGAVVASLLAYCGVPMTIQIIVFFVVSIAFMIILKPLRDNIIRGKGRTLDSLVGKRCIISKLPDERGLLKVRLNGVDWNADIQGRKANDSIDTNVYTMGMVLYIVELNGNTLIVSEKPANNS